jgi:hypothetical protein
MTKNQLLKRISTELNIPRDYIDLLKLEGEYYWEGKLGAVLTSTLIGRATLKDTPYSFWVDDLSNKINNFTDEWNPCIVEYIESINWEVEYE